MKDDPVWLAAEDAMVVHELLLEEHGGLAGVRDTSLLKSALARPRNHFAFGESDWHRLAAVYADGIVNNHPFNDGNKRTGFLLAAWFLELNGFAFTAPEDQAVAMTVGLADKSVSIDMFTQWLRDNSQPR